MEWPPIKVPLCPIKFGRRLVLRAWATALTIMLLAGVFSLMLLFMPDMLHNIELLRHEKPPLFYLGATIGGITTVGTVAWRCINAATEIEGEIERVSS